MAITKKFLKDQIKKLEVNYGRDKFRMTQDVFDLWYEMFEHCDEKGFELAINKCLKESEFPPNIATVSKCYKELEDEKNELKETIQHQYATMRSIWREEYDSDTFYTIVDYIQRFPKKTRKVEMIELQQRAVSFFHDCDACGRVERPTIKEYVEGKR